MKKTLLIASAAVLTLTACTGELERIDNGKPDNGITVLKATAEPRGASRAAFTTSSDPEVTQDVGEFFWTNNDKVGVYGEGLSTPQQYDIIEGQGGQVAEFEGLTVKSRTYAVYPYNENTTIEGTALTLNLPASYTAGSTPEEYPTTMNAAFPGIAMPMLAKIPTDEHEIKFRHLVGVVCFQLTNIPAGTEEVEFSTDAKINGNFTIDIDGFDPNTPGTYKSISSQTSATASEKKVSVKFTSDNTNTTTRVVYFPLPCGTYDSFQITLYNASGTRIASPIESTQPLTINRKDAVIYKDIQSVPSNGEDYNVQTTRKDL